jgi:excisionase family DNA binding protein
MVSRARPERRTTPYCTTREAAQRLGVSVRTVQQWAERGVLDVWKTAGGHRRIGVHSLERFMSGAAAARPSAGPGAPFKLVVADDDAALLRLYQVRIREWDPHVALFAARDGCETLLVVGREQPNMLITELAMPGADGLQMVRTLAAHPYSAGLQIIAVSALAPAVLAARGGLPSAVSFHAKPVLFGTLEREVRAAAAGWRALAACQ